LNIHINTLIFYNYLNLVNKQLSQIPKH